MTVKTGRDLLGWRLKVFELKGYKPCYWIGVADLTESMLKTYPGLLWCRRR